MSRTKKVLFISHFYEPHKGGVEKHIREISQIMLKDYDISLLTLNFSGDLPKIEKNKELKIYRFRTIYIKYVGLIFIWLKLLLYVPLFLRQDVIHIHDVFIWVLPYRLLFFWKKFYITFHGWEGDYPINTSSIFQKKIAAFLCQGYISVGEYINIHYGLKADLVTYGGATPPKKNVLVPKRKQITYIGRLSRDQGIPVLIKAIKGGTYRVDFCGKGDYQKECELIGTVHGFVENIDQILANSKICVAGGYLSTIESLSHGCSTVVIAQNKLRHDIFACTPFYKWINIAHTSTDLIKIIDSLSKNTLPKEATNWARKQTWNAVVEKYIFLWNR